MPTPAYLFHAITPAALAELSSHQGAPCISILQPTHRRHPENQQDQIRFRQLLKAVETSLRHGHSAESTKALLEPFNALAQDRDFWNNMLDGLAVLGSPGLFRVFLLPRAMPELSVVAESFHTKPLRRFLQSVERYQVLGLSLNSAQLFEGNRDSLFRVPMAAAVPTTMAAALGDEVTEPHSTVSSYGGVGVGRGAMHHGHGGKRDEIDGDAERFFRAVDRAVTEHHSRPSGLPLILAALPEHHHRFREVSHNPFLMGVGVMANPGVLTLEELQARAWLVVEPQYRQQQAAWTDAYAAARAKGLASDDMAQVAEAAVAGRVATLLLDAERTVGGRIDPANGRIVFAALEDPRVDDVLDDLGEVVGRMGGEVHVLSADRMPGRTGVAATFRY
jgi:hypothetical protein